MTIFCFGDSITYGNWDSQGGWVGRLRSYLDSKSLSAYKGADLYSTYYTLTYNLGIPGDTSSSLLARFEEELLSRFNPDEETVLLFAIGINDSRFYQSLGEFETAFELFQENIWNIWETARKYSQEIAFIGLTPVDEERTAPLYWEPDAVYKNEYIERYNEFLREFCDRREIPFIDILDRVKNLDIPSLLEDGIHPNGDGYQVMFDIIEKEVFRDRK
jgi:lysophospholipase L1-like esterase